MPTFEDPKRGGAVSFTPGPWKLTTVPTQIGHCHKVEPIGACVYVDHRNLREKDTKTITALANTRLITAAPDLLAACQRANAVLEDYVHGEVPEMCAMAETLEDCIAAISKATQ